MPIKKNEQINFLCKTSASNPDRWTELITTIHKEFSTSGAVLFTPDTHIPEAFGVAHGSVAQGVADYFTNWSSQDAWNLAVAGKNFFQTAGEVRQGHEFLSDSALRRTDFFNEWALAFEAEQVLSLKVEDGSGYGAPVMHLSLFRRFKDAPFSVEDRARLNSMWPHLRLAAQTHWALRGVRLTAVQESLNALPFPTWVIRENRWIDFANIAANDLMGRGTWVRQTGGYLSRLGRFSLDSIAMLLRRAALGQKLEAFPVQSEGQLRAGLLRLVPIREAPQYQSVWPRASLLIMMEVPDESKERLWIEHLTEYHRLTPAQRMVLEHLKSGLSVQDIAEYHGIRQGTVRSHVHALLEKTGLERQIDLVRLALGVRTLKK